MKFRQIISAAVTFSIAVLLCGSCAFAATAGSADDPLISKSYIDNTYPPLVLAEPQEYLSQSIEVLDYKLSQAKNTVAPTTTYYLITTGGSLSLQAGSGFVLISGAANLTTSTGTVIDLTDGTTVAPGANLSPAHKYLAAENATATVTMTADSRISTIGTVKILSGASITFTDVPVGIWYYDDVAYAVQKGLINGRSATEYDPGANLTIAEAIKLAACMHELYHTGSVTLKNDSDIWYNSYVAYAKENNICTKTYSNYYTKITRREFVYIFYNSLPASEYTVINTVADNSIPDVTSTSSYVSEIYAFYRAGILTGYDDGNFYPDNNIKRSEVAAILTRMFESDARKQLS
jgi:hypothetical protein